jgi:deoxyadenosine/deoxycytidine kinase
MANPPKRSPDTAAASPKAAAASPSAKPAAGGSDSKETTSPEDAARAANMPIILLLGIDGLTGAGKSTLCRELKTRVIREGYTPHILYEDISGKVFQDLLHAASEKPERFEAIKQAVFIGNRTRRVAETLEHIQGNAKPGSVHVIVVDRTWFGDMTMAKAANLDEVSAAALSQLTKDLAYFQYSFSFVYCIRKHTKTIAAQIKERGRVFEQGRNGLTHKKLHAQTEAYRDIVRRLMRQEGLNLRESSRSDETRQHADNCMRVLKKLLQNMQG